MPTKMLSLKVRLEPIPVRDYHRRLRLVTELLEQQASRPPMPPVETQSLRAAVATQPSSNQLARSGGQK
jgi:hypothetical protein